MRLGFYTYSYTDRLKLPVVDCLQRIARTGYSGIDVSGTNGPSVDPKSVTSELRRLTRQTAERLHLRIEAVITHHQLADAISGSKRGPLDLAGTVDLAVDLGAPLITFHMGGYPRDVPRDIFWRRIVSTIRQVADYGAARHVAVAVDGIWPPWVDDSPDTLERLFHDVDSPNFGVNLDPSYLTLMGVDPVDFVKRFPKRILHAHLKDHDAKGRYPKWTHLIPGRGVMDYARVLAALDRIKFDGSCSIECDTSMKFEEACDEGYRALTSAAQRAGVRFTRARQPAG